MSSGPQDHQLRGSGGPTIFLVVLTAPMITTLGNLEPNLFMLAMCFHIVDFAKPQKAWEETVQGWWSISMSIIDDPHDYEHVFMVLSSASCDDCLYLWVMLRFWLGLDILEVHRTTGPLDMNVLVVRHNFWWSRTTVSCERWRLTWLIITVNLLG